jgi:hypothetical protein
MAPEVRDRLRSLIAAELGAAWDAAVAAGADPEELAGIVDERRRRIQSVGADGPFPESEGQSEKSSDRRIRRPQD